MSGGSAWNFNCNCTIPPNAAISGSPHATSCQYYPVLKFSPALLEELGLVMDVEKKPVKLDLACGDNKQPGFQGVDKFKTPAVDIEADLFVAPWPFEDNSVDEVYCSHFIEHHPNLCLFWAELYRILKPGGKATIIAPYGQSNRAWQDPTHVRCIVEQSFWYAQKAFREGNKLSHYLPPNVDFDCVVSYQGIDPHWASRSQESLMFAIKHYNNVVNDVMCIMTKKVPG